MNALQHLFFVLALSFGLATTSVYAQQIRQPVSILPYWATQAESIIAVEKPATSDISDSPAWLLETAEQRPKRSKAQNALPMVETESFVSLGQLHGGSSKPSGLSVQRNRQPFNLFRALGIQATRRANRR